MSVNVQPLGPFVVAQPEAAPAKTASGLYLPEKSVEKPKVAKVLAVGKEVRELKVGDRILYSSFSRAEVFKVGAEEFLLIEEKDVLATLK